jgi:hypothetical protein
MNTLHEKVQGGGILDRDKYKNGRRRTKKTSLEMEVQN